MRLTRFLCLLTAGVLAACAPGAGQPAYSVGDLPAATSIPPQPGPAPLLVFSGRITDFDVSPDGRVLAVATSGDVRLFDMQTFQLLRRLSPGELVGAVAWSRDGSRLAIASSKDSGKVTYVGGDAQNPWKAHLVVYDTASWQAVFEPALGNEMLNQGFYDLAWSPDGHALAYSTDLGGVEVIDAHTGDTLSLQTTFAATVTSLTWSPDGSRLVANHDQANTLRRWRLSDGDAIRLFDPRTGSAMAVAWSPDGQRIASGHNGGGVCLWTAATNRCDAYFRAHRSATFSVAWSPDGTQLATGGGVLRIWDPQTGALLRGFGEESGFLYTSLQWPSASTLLSLETGINGSADTVLRVWDVSTGAIRAEFRGAGR